MSQEEEKNSDEGKKNNTEGEMEIKVSRMWRESENERKNGREERVQDGLSRDRLAEVMRREDKRRA